MRKYTRPSKARLAQIYARQDPPGFGPHYKPAIRANREEAPARSRPAWVWWDTVKRDLSTLSSVERSILLICLHNERVWEVHDQRMLPVLPSPHPLSTHPRAAGMVLPAMRGTVEIAERLGVLALHPFVRIAAEDGSGRCSDVPFPWIGDFLLFLEDEMGPYAVNLTVKDRPDEFQQSSFDGVKPANRAGAAHRKAQARHAVEEQLYADVGIRTVRVTREDYDASAVANLTQIFLWHHRETPFDAEQRKTIVDNFRAAMGAGVPPIEVTYALALRHRWKAHDLKAVFYQALWRRELRADLFEPIVFDRALRPEKRDLIAIHDAWFRRT